MSARHGLPRYEWVQNEYNLLTRDDEREVFALIREHGLGYTPFSPLGGGLLSGRYRRGAPIDPRSRMAIAPGAMRELTDEVWDALDFLERKAVDRGVATGALALAWVLSRAEVTAALVAPRTTEQLHELEAALTISLDEDERAELAAAFDRV